jgi:hypothetical protein
MLALTMHFPRDSPFSPCISRLCETCAQDQENYNGEYSVQKYDARAE